LDDETREQIKITNERKSLHTILEHKGKMEGKQEERLEIAIEMIKEGLPKPTISKVTKLSIEEIEKLENELKIS